MATRSIISRLADRIDAVARARHPGPPVSAFLTFEDLTVDALRWLLEVDKKNVWSWPDRQFFVTENAMIRALLAAGTLTPADITWSRGME